jgi:hypothetical protein
VKPRPSARRARGAAGLLAAHARQLRPALNRGGAAGGCAEDRLLRAREEGSAVNCSAIQISSIFNSV